MAKPAEVRIKRPRIMCLYLYDILEEAQSFSGGGSGKESACQCRRRKRRKFDPWVEKTPWRRAWQPSPVSLPGESQGQRCLAGYNPQGHKELDITKAT